jgi:hypothetical protein
MKQKKKLKRNKIVKLEKKWKNNLKKIENNKVKEIKSNIRKFSKNL